MLDSTQIDVCDACESPIEGAEAGCSAMDKKFHARCFCCAICRAPISGEFYEHDGKPHCERDYLSTRDKCSACNEPIVDRLLNANSRKYHPRCFRCFVCAKVLDNEPFVVAPNNEVHCIDDYHDKYAPRCSVCKLPIVADKNERETFSIVALERNFHVRCYKCEDCSLQLASNVFASTNDGGDDSSNNNNNESTAAAANIGCYPLDGRILCRECNKQRQRNNAAF